MKLFGSGPKRLCNPRRTFGAIFIVVQLGFAANAIAAGATAAVGRRAGVPIRPQRHFLQEHPRDRHAAARRSNSSRIRPPTPSAARHHQRPGSRPAEQRARAARRAPSILSVHHDRRSKLENYRDVDHRRVAGRQTVPGVTGAGVGVAVIDSGITSWHDDLTSSLDRSVSVRQSARRRVRRFRQRRARRLTTIRATDRTSRASSPATATTRTASKPAWRRTRASSSLKVLDANGKGKISNIIAALDWVLANHAKLQHPRRQPVGRRGDSRVVLDRPADARRQAGRRRRRGRGAAAGNLGRNADGTAAIRGHHRARQRAMGAHRRRVDHQRHTNRGDDAMASFSSGVRPYIDWAAKPDLVAPGSARSRSPIRAAHSTRRRRSSSCRARSRPRTCRISPERHQHGGAGRDGHGRVDAAGESGADAERGQGILQYTAQKSPRATTR